MGREETEAVNRAANAKLEEDLKSVKANRIIQAIGMDPVGEWREEGFAVNFVHEIDAGQQIILDLAKKYQQAAIYRHEFHAASGEIIQSVVPTDPNIKVASSVAINRIKPLDIQI
jgi:Protein of unknown function (DUF3293)